MTRKTSSLICILLITLCFSNCSQPGSEIVRFAFLTDLHVSPEGESSENLLMIVQEINASALDFVIVSGDVTNQGSDAEFLNVKSILDELQIPYYIVPGNHETNWSESAGLKFIEIWGDDRFIFKKGNFLFAGINTGPFMRMGDGHVKQEDINWLKRELQKQMKPDMKLVFTAHYPLAEGLDQWYLITDILGEYHPAVALCGHGHRQQLLNFGGIPGIMGRSMVLRGENTPGYNIVELRNDSVFSFEKEPGVEIGSARISFNMNAPLPHLEIATSTPPDYSVNDLYPHIRPVFEWNDSASVFTGPLIAGDTILVYGNSQGVLSSVDIRTKKIYWSLQLDGPLYATPVSHGELLITGDSGGNFYGIGMTDGKIQWQTNVGSPVLSEGLMDEGFYYAGAGTAGFYCIRPENGEVLWRFDETEGLIQARAAVYGEYVVFTAWDRHVYCLDKNSGSLIWKWNNQKPQALFSPGNVVPVISNDKVFIVAPDRYMTALDLKNGREIWRSNRHQVRESMGLSPDGKKVIAKLMNDSVVAVSTEGNTLKTLWAIDAGFGYDHNPVPLVGEENLIFAATKNGLIIAINISDQKVEWKYKAGNSALNFFAIDENRQIWFTTTNGKIMALRF